jgi:hypothetical protein
VPASNPDILVGNDVITRLYEVKPAANQLGQIIWGVSGIRGDNNASQVPEWTMDGQASRRRSTR